MSFDFFDWSTNEEVVIIISKHILRYEYEASQDPVEISIHRMPGKIKFRIKIIEIIVITKTSSTIDDDIRSNVILHTSTYSTCHDHLQFTPMNDIPTLFCHPICNTSHCLWLERKYLSNPFYLITEIFTSSSPRPHYALNGPLSSRTHLPWTFSQDFPITNGDVITTSKISPACSQYGLDREKRKASRD